MARSRAAAHPHVRRAETYARAVVVGKIPACRWIRLACQRHLDDRRRSRGKVFPYRFDPQAAQRICTFAELLPHVKGQWAIPKAGDPRSILIRLEDWQCFFLCVLFGWVEKGIGLRRFRVALLMVPRKNGKSVLAAIIGLYMFAADKEQGAEVYSGAVTEKQAWEVFRPALLMAKASPAFVQHYGVDPRAKTMVRLSDHSRFEPVIGKPGDGASPHLAITDEYHEHPDPVQYETMITGMGARQQPLMLVITTAGDNIAGPCYALQEEVQQMLEGRMPNDRLFGLIYTIDLAKERKEGEKGSGKEEPGDDWTSEIALRKANPNFGVSVGADYLRNQQREAAGLARKQGTFKTKHLNIWVTARDAWMNMEWWDRQGDSSLRPDQFFGCPCFGAGDLASKVDLAPFVRVFRQDREDGEPHYYAFCRTYCPEATVHEPAHRNYQGWIDGGHLIATEGEVIDYTRIQEDILQDAADHGFELLAWDPWGATQMMTELQQNGLSVMSIEQTTKHLSDPMKWVEALVKAGRLHHNGDPCFAWQISNVTAREDANENVFPRKERRELKVDAALALIMALSRAMVHELTASVYEERGMLEL